MRLNKVRILSGIVAFGLLAGVGTIVPSTIITPTANAVDGTEITFENAKKKAKPQSLSFGEYQIQVWVVPTGSFELNRSREFMLFGEVALPYTATELNIEEFESKVYLPFDNNHIVTNGGLKTRLQWQVNGNKYDSRVFKSENVLRSTKSTFDLVIDGNKQELKVPSDEQAGLNLEPLESAITEHHSVYSAAKTRGMEFVQETLDTFLASIDKARKIIEQASTENKPSQQEVNKAREELNQAASDLKPKPFDRTNMNKYIAQANDKIAENGKNGTRYTPDTYKEFQRAYANAVKINATPDYDSIQVSAHGDPQVTHREFNEIAAKLNEAIENLQTQSYTELDVSQLREAYEKALVFSPSKGKGFEAKSRENFAKTIADVKDFLDDHIYKTKEQAQAKLAELTQAKEKLTEIVLGKEIKIKVSYQHPMPDSVSDLIHENFRDKSGNIVEDIITAHEGEELRIRLNNPLVKKFEGYTPVSFHLNSDDGSHRFVRVLELPNGEKVISLRATAPNSDGVGSLVIRYVTGEDNRVLSKDPVENKPEDSNKENQDTPKKENSKENSEANSGTKPQKPDNNVSNGNSQTSETKTSPKLVKKTTQDSGKQLHDSSKKLVNTGANLIPVLLLGITFASIGLALRLRSKQNKS